MHLDRAKVSEIQERLPLLEEHEIYWFFSQSGLQERNPKAHAIRLMFHTQRIRSSVHYQEPGEGPKRRVRLGKRERTRIATAPLCTSSAYLSRSYGVPTVEIQRIRSRFRGYKITC